ncbi:MAG: hypothetical protein ACRC8K_26415, partial [Waterburya sp.]
MATDDSGTDYVTNNSIEIVLKITADSSRKILASESFKAFAGNGFNVGKRSGKSTKYRATGVLYPKSTFLSLVYFLARKKDNSPSSNAALDLLTSGFVADFEGAVSHAKGDTLSEEQREYLRTLVSERIQ